LYELRFSDIDLASNRIVVARRLYWGTVDVPKNGQPKTIALVPPARDKLGLFKRAIAAQAGWSEEDVDAMLRVYGHLDLVALSEVDALHADTTEERIEA
jgi:hypothetical protein